MGLSGDSQLCILKDGGKKIKHADCHCTTACVLYTISGNVYMTRERRQLVSVIDFR